MVWQKSHPNRGETNARTINSGRAQKKSSTAYMMVAIKSSKLQVNLHNEEMKGNEMTAKLSIVCRSWSSSKQALLITSTSR